MVVNCLYYGKPELSVSNPAIISPSGEVREGGYLTTDVIEKALHNIYRRDFSPAENIEPNMFRAFAKTLTKAVNTVLPELGENPMIHALRHSAEVFAAFKVHRAQNDMAARMLDSNGVLKQFEQWANEVMPIASHHCGQWLETEYNTAVLRARQAANWQQFQKEKDILPNLRWLPSTSPNPGADHRKFWNTVLPVDHPFWDRHRPGDRWNCKCDLTSTDETPTPVPDDGDAKDKPQQGLDENPGKTQAVFSDSHPYFPKDCRHCDFYKPTAKARITHLFTAKAKDCFNCPYINGCIERTQEVKKLVKERRKEARKAVQGKTLHNPGFTGDILVSRASVDEWVNQPFKYMSEKFDMLLDIENVIARAKYVGKAGNHKKVEGVITSHIFQIKVMDIDAFIIVREYDSGEYVLHSISDAQDFIKYIQKE